MADDDDFIPYARQVIDDDDIAAVIAALTSDFLTTGPAVEQFENALSRQTGGLPIVAVSSGTAALHAAYAAAGVGPGRDLLTSPMTFAGTATTALHLGARVEFADVDDATLTLDPNAAAAGLRPGMRVVTAVDFAGHPAAMDEINAVARTVGATVVQDAAHSLGGSYRGRPIGTCADLTIFSFHPVKTVTTAEGGAVAVRDATFVDAVRRFRNHGLVRDVAHLARPDEGGWHQEIQTLGLNYRLPDVLAALGTSQLRKLEWFAQRRAALVERYHAGLSDCPGVRLPVARPDTNPVWHLFAVRILDGRREQVYEHLRRHRIGAQVHYLPVHRQPLFESLGYRAGMCPVAEGAYEELLSLPLYPALSDVQHDRVVTELRSALGY